MGMTGRGDTCTNNLYVVSLDGSGGQNLGNIGGLLDFPFAIAVDSSRGNIYITRAVTKRSYAPIWKVKKPQN